MYSKSYGAAPASDQPLCMTTVVAVLCSVHQHQRYAAGPGALVPRQLS